MLPLCKEQTEAFPRGPVSPGAWISNQVCLMPKPVGTFFSYSTMTFSPQNNLSDAPIM